MGNIHMEQTNYLDYHRITIQLALENSNYHQRSSNFVDILMPKKRMNLDDQQLGLATIAPAPAVKLQTAESHAAVRHVFTTFIEGLLLEQI